MTRAKKPAGCLDALEHEVQLTALALELEAAARATLALERRTTVGVANAFRIALAMRKVASDLADSRESRDALAASDELEREIHDLTGKQRPRLRRRTS